MLLLQTVFILYPPLYIEGIRYQDGRVLTSGGSAYACTLYIFHFHCPNISHNLETPAISVNIGMTVSHFQHVE